MAILQTTNLKKYYGSGDTLVKALDGVNLRVENGEFVAIVGTSGSGKSTLLHMLGGLDRPTGGSVLVEGRDIFALKDEELTIFRRRKIGFVFQSYNLVPALSVYDNIVLPIQLDGGRVDEAYVNQVIEALGLEQKLDRLPGDTEFLGKLLLGQPQVPAQLQQRIPCLHSIASFLPSIADRLRMHKQRAVAEFLPLCSILERLWKDCSGTMETSERSASP